MKNTLRIKNRTLYYVALFVYVLSMNIQLSYLHNGWAANQSRALLMIQMMRYGAYLLCIVRIATMRQLKWFSLVFAAALLAASLYATFTGTENAPIFYFILLLCALETDFRTIVKLFMDVQLCTLALFMLMSLAGISGDTFVNDMGRIRYFLGYGWVNRASYCWFFICLEYLYLKKNRLNWLQALVGAAVAVFIFVMTRTMFSMLMTFGVIAYGLGNRFLGRFRRRRRKRHPRALAALCIGAFMMTIVIGLVLPMIYNAGNPVLYRMNRLVNGRLELGKTAINRYGLHLGGNQLQWVGSSTLMFGLSESNEYFYVDNGFLQLALEYGVLFVAFVIFAYLGAIWKSCRSGDYPLCMCMLILGVLYVFEPYVIDFAFNPFVIYYFSRLTVRTDLFGRKRAARPAAQLPPGEGAASESMEVPL